MLTLRVTDRPNEPVYGYLADGTRLKVTPGEYQAREEFRQRPDTKVRGEKTGCLVLKHPEPGGEPLVIVCEDYPELSDLPEPWGRFEAVQQASDVT